MYASYMGPYEMVRKRWSSSIPVRERRKEGEGREEGLRSEMSEVTLIDEQKISFRSASSPSI